MALQPVFGCWVWDGDAECIMNGVTGERLRLVGTDAPSSPWGGRPYLVRYEADDFRCDVAVSVFQEFGPSLRREPFWRSIRASVKLLSLYQVDLGRTARLSGYGDELPFGIWQRLIEFVPEAILFWPRAWPGLEDPANGPGRPDAARCVRTLGVWANGCWLPESRVEFVIETRFGLDPTVPCHVMDKQHWSLADLSAVPPPPFVFLDKRTPEEAANDQSPWPNFDDVERWLVSRGFSDSLPEQTQIQVPTNLFEKVPHCRSSNGERYFFFTSGLKVLGGHSPTIGPSFCLISGDVWFPGQVTEAGINRGGAAGADQKSKHLKGSADRTGNLRLVKNEEWHRYHYSVPPCDDFDPSEKISLTQEGRRLVWQNMLDAFASWKPEQGVHPAIRVRERWEREKDPDSIYVRWPIDDLEMLPFSWVDLRPPTSLAGIDRQPPAPQKQAIQWNASKSYVSFDLGE